MLSPLSTEIVSTLAVNGYWGNLDVIIVFRNGIKRLHTEVYCPTSKARLTSSDQANIMFLEDAPVYKFD